MTAAQRLVRDGGGGGELPPLGIVELRGITSRDGVPADASEC
jgi:hypothetical protein